MRRFVLLAAAICFVCLSTGAGAAPGLAGRWKLAWQSRSDRSAGAPILAPIPLLECAGAGRGLRCFIHAGGPAARVYDWPAFVSDAGPLPLVLEEREVDDLRGRLSARYRVAVPGPDRQSLIVQEAYAVDPEDGALVGTVEMTLVQDAEPRGSLKVRRRFVREP